MAAKRKKKRKIKKGFLVFLIITIALLIIGVSLFVVLKFVPNVNILSIKQIEIMGDAVYSEDDIILASGLIGGKSIFEYNLNKVEKKIEKELPYVKTANINYKLDGTVKIQITATEVAFSVKSENGYYNLDSNFKLLESLSNTQKGMLIYGIDLVEEIQTGEMIVDESNDKIAILGDLLNGLDAYSLNADVIDLEDVDDIMFVYKGRYIVQFGSVSSMEEKIKMLNILSSDLAENETGRILLKYWSNDDRYGSVIAENIDEYLNKY